MQASNRPETVMCAAVWVDTGELVPNQPVPSGYVVGGRRHSGCLSAAWACGNIDDLSRSRVLGMIRQGFLTSAGRYVTREEAASIALACGQIPVAKDMLFSEDLW